MAVDPSELSIAEIRRRFVRDGEAVSGQLLKKLQRDPRRGVREVYQVLRRRQERAREERARLDAMLHFERLLWENGVERIAGVDEAGVGPLAGPVLAAAVVFPPGTGIAAIDDSKRLDAAEREALATLVREHAIGVAVGVAEVEEIDRLNVYHATLLAMRRAVEALPTPPEHVLVDAREIPALEIPQNRFNKGDGLNFSIAAASIIAKTERDRLMRELERRYPGYGLATHKGYSTAEHQEAIRRLGPSPIHRRSYPVIAELTGEYSEAFYRLRDRLEGARDPDRLRAFEAELEAARADLADREHRKLKLLLDRRWDRRGTG